MMTILMVLTWIYGAGIGVLFVNLTLDRINPHNIERLFEQNDRKVPRGLLKVVVIVSCFIVSLFWPVYAIIAALMLVASRS